MDLHEIYTELTRAQERIAEREGKLSELAIEGLALRHEGALLVLDIVGSSLRVVREAAIAEARAKAASDEPKAKTHPKGKAGRPPKDQTREICAEWIKQGSPKVTAKVCDNIGTQFFAERTPGKETGVGATQARSRAGPKNAFWRAQHN